MKKIKQQSKNKSDMIKEPDPYLKFPSFEKPVFSFSNMRNGSYNIDSCNEQQKASLSTKISKIGQLTWQELKTTHKHGLGYEKIHKTSIKDDNINDLGKDIQLIAFRFWKKAPMVGYRCSKGAFHILWLDIKFKLYKH